MTKPPLSEAASALRAMRAAKRKVAERYEVTNNELHGFHGTVRSQGRSAATSAELYARAHRHILQSHRRHAVPPFAAGPRG